MPALLVVLALWLPLAASAQGVKPGIDVMVTPKKPAQAVVAPQAVKLHKEAATLQVRNVTAVNRAATQISVKAFDRQESLTEYRTATASLDRAAKTLQQKADTLSKQDFILTEARLTVAARHAAQINARALKGERISNEEVARLTTVTAPTEIYAARMMMGEPPVPRQTVTVRLVDAQTGDVQGRKVYALPADYMQYPDLFTAEMFKTAIDEFSFDDETSPTSKLLPASAINLWVGPRMMQFEMAALAKQGRVMRYRPLNVVGAANGANVEFVAPDDIIQP